MISKSFKLTTVAALVGVALVGVGCKNSKNNGSNGVVYTPTTAPATNLTQAYKYIIVFLDAATGQPVADDLQVTFAGPATVVDNNGVSVAGKTFDVKQAMAVASDLAGTDDNFTVIASNSTAGWVKTGVKVSKATSSEGSQTIEVKLVNTKNAAALNNNTNVGIAMAVSTAPAGANNAITDQAAGLTVTTPAKTVTNTSGAQEAIGTATITIPSGTKAYATEADAAAGTNPITVTGNISLSAVKFGTNSTSSLSAFPGGFQPTIAGNATGNFITGGFAQFNLTDSNGNVLKNFDKPLNLTIDLPKVSKKVDGTALNPGDTYDVWSYNESTGQWVKETSGIIQLKASDPTNAASEPYYEVKFTSKHLSYWNLDFHIPTSCTGRINLQRPAGDARYLQVELLGLPSNMFYNRYQFMTTDSNLTFRNYPGGQKATVMIKDLNGRLLGSTTPVDICATPPTINLVNPLPTNINVDVNVTESCPDGSNKRALPTNIWMNLNYYIWRSGYAYKAANSNVATATFRTLPVGQSARLYVYDRNTRWWDQRQVTIGSSINVNLPTMTCKAVRPTGAVGR